MRLIRGGGTARVGGGRAGFSRRLSPLDPSSRALTKIDLIDAALPRNSY
jgi:hypothetical protein